MIVRAIALLAMLALASFAAERRVVVEIFVSSECPISNKMAPEIERLTRKFDGMITLVYPNESDTEEKIAAHRREYKLSAPAVRDPEHKRVKAAKATVTPEAAVLGARRTLLYRGRINDQFLAVGKGKPAPTRHDLEDAIVAALNGQKPHYAHIAAVGCYIEKR